VSYKTAISVSNGSSVSRTKHVPTPTLYPYTNRSSQQPGIRTGRPSMRGTRPTKTLEDINEIPDEGQSGKTAISRVDGTSSCPLAGMNAKFLYTNV